MSIEVKCVNGHYEAYIDGRFAASGDTYKEAEEAAEEVN